MDRLITYLHEAVSTLYEVAPFILLLLSIFLLFLAWFR